MTVAAQVSVDELVARILERLVAAHPSLAEGDWTVTVHVENGRARNVALAAKPDVSVTLGRRALQRMI